MEPSQPQILIFVLWFGAWPAWARFYFASCRYNPTVNWLIITDCEPLPDTPENVSFLKTTLSQYRRFVSNRLSINCEWSDAYKLCDIRPLLGYLHPDLIDGFDCWGYTDIDVIYGNIRSIYTPQVLQHEIISSHPNIAAGHFTLIRNIPRLNLSFTRVRGWKNLISRKAHRGFDEYQWSHLFTPVQGTYYKRLKQRIRSPYMKVDRYFVEQHSTSLIPLPWIDGTCNYPKAWYWREGRLTAERAENREFLYCHFTHFASNRQVLNGIAPWTLLDRIDNCPPGPVKEFKISASGFSPL